MWDKKGAWVLFVMYWNFFTIFFCFLQDQKLTKNINSTMSMDIPIFTYSKIPQSMGRLSANFFSSIPLAFRLGTTTFGLGVATSS